MKTAIKILLIITGISGALFPLAFGLTDPDNYAWVFYTDITLLFGSIILAVTLIGVKVIDSLN